MTDFWQNLTIRERVMVSVAGVLAVLVLGCFAVVRPLTAYEDESKNALARAQAVYQQIAAGAAEVEASRADAKIGGSQAPSVRVAVAQSARDAGIAISRLQPGSDGALTVWVESVSSPVFFTWLEALGAQYGIAPTKVMAQKSTADGRLRVQLEFGGV